MKSFDMFPSPNPAPSPSDVSTIPGWCLRVFRFPLPLVLAVAGIPQQPLLAEQPSKTPPPATNTTPSTWCRFIPERMDDFAWENDLVAFRAYGPAIQQSHGSENSGVDVWLKRVRYPIVDRWYALNRVGFPYHVDHGEGNDPYHTGQSRGCGGTALWKDGKMILAGPFKTWKIISREKDRSVFELSYDYGSQGNGIREIKRITIVMGDRLYRSESTFTMDGKPLAGLEIAVGITTHDGKAGVTLRPEQGWMSCWESIEGYGVGTGVVVAPGRVAEMREISSKEKDVSHALLVTRTDKEGRTMHLAGYGWTKAGQITSREAWENYLVESAATLKAKAGGK